jgi:hypothetical protein
VNSSTEGISEPSAPAMNIQWGAHVKCRGSVSWPDESSVFQLVGTQPLYDGAIETRIRNNLFFSNWGSFETHYEAVLSGGDKRRKAKALEKLYPGLPKAFPVVPATPEDDRRLMDLTATVSDDESYVLYHRLDRLALTIQPNWGLIRVGRQAVTWGNGLLFNPMDLFNPFSPSDIERDYKIGDDLVFLQYTLDQKKDFQLLYVPRRDLASKDITWNQSSSAGKFHFSRGTTEFDVMAAKHFEDTVIGLGSVGYVSGAAWRMDITWTHLNNNASNSYLSAIANMDYSWLWWKKNFYGFLEFYFNGLCHDRYAEELTDPQVTDRLARGELYSLGRSYLGGYIRVELHPLLNVYLTIITNLSDPSGLVQPRMVCDFTQNTQIMLGGNFAYGRKDTEYGGFNIPGTPFYTRSPDSVFAWISYYF